MSKQKERQVIVTLKETITRVKMVTLSIPQETANACENNEVLADHASDCAVNIMNIFGGEKYPESYKLNEAQEKFGFVVLNCVDTNFNISTQYETTLVMDAATGEAISGVVKGGK